MSGSSSPVNGGYEAATAEPTMRLTVRKDLFPEVRLPKLSPVVPHKILIPEDVSCVKLETDFEQSIDEIANQKIQVNGAMLSPIQPRHRKHKQHSRHSSKRSTFNGTLDSKHKKLSHYSQRNKLSLQVKGGKNLNLVSSSDCAEEERSVDSDSSDDEVLQPVIKLPYNIPRSGGKPYSHKISQLSKKKGKSKNIHKEKRSHNIIPCSGKPRSMLSICSSRSKKKSKKSECTATYQSQIVDTKTNIKIKIRKTNVHEMVAPTPASIADLGQRKSKKKRAASPVASESSGEEYDPSRGDTAAAMSVAAPKPRHPPPKTRKPNNTKNKHEKTERSRVSVTEKVTGPQSPWAQSIPEEILAKIFECVVSSQGTLPTVIRLGKVCKLWHIVSCRHELWKNVDLAQYTTEKCKTDYKLVWLLENRLSLCHSLNIAQWKVGNMPWVLACVADYCPGLVELSLAGWSRLTPDQLFDLVQGLPKLQRLDLSHTSETSGSSTCLSASSVARVADSCGARLTHLTLANNMFTALPQILSTIASCCPNLEVLDISGARATSHPAMVPLEALQKGCPKMRVFRAANAQLVLANTTTSQQMEATGWSQLEELSIAGDAAEERVGVGEYRLGDEALARLVRGATRLQLLDLRGLQRLTDSGLVRVPAWDLQHLFLGGCNVTRQSNACLELICEKWSHSLLEIDLSWASAKRVLDDAVAALADASSSKLRILNLCGSSVSLEPVKKVLLKCQHLESLNLSSCRALPRGMKRLYTGKELQDLKDSLDPHKVKTKEESDSKEEKKKKDVKKSEADSKWDSTIDSSKPDICKGSNMQEESYAQEKLTSSSMKEPTSVPEFNKQVSDKQEPTELPTKSSPDSKSQELSISKDIETETSDFSESSRSVRNATPKLLSPIAQAKPDSSSTPSSVPSKTDIRSPHFSPVSKPDSLVQNSPEIQMDLIKNNNSSWTSGNIKTTPTHKIEGSLNKMDSYSKLKHGKLIEQCSPTTSLDNKPSPETLNVKPNSWNYSPMPKQDNQFSSQRSPYSAQPSPAQPSPYSTQPSPYSTQPSPYSSQPSPYSAQPSPDTSQIVKPDIQKTSSWNTGNFSPMPKHHSPFSPLPSTHASPDPGLGMKNESLRSNPNRTPGQYSPMSRQDRHHNSPYSPRSSVDNVSYSNKRSPGMGNYSPMMRNDCHLPSPEAPQLTRSLITQVGRQQDIYGRSVKPPEMIQNVTADHSNSWGMERFNQVSVTTPSIESLVWGSGGPFSSEPQPRAELPSLLHTPPPPQHAWSGLPSFDNSVQRPNNDLSDPWTLGQFRVEPPHQVHNFVEQAISFDTLSGHVDLPSHITHSFLDDSFTETSRVD